MLVFRVLTSSTVTPGRLAALLKMGAFLSSSATTMSTETGVRYFLFLMVPLPARILRPSLARSRS